MSKAYHCAAHDCSNGGYKLKKWKDGSCSIHNSQRSSPYCSCEPDFKLYPFPTRGTDPENRRKWQQLINRQDKKGKLWSPSKDTRVCSRHFKEGRPTEECPYPTENLGYDSTSKVANILQPQKRRRIHRHTLVSLALGKNVKDNELNSEDSDSGCYIQSQGDNETFNGQVDNTRIM